MFSTFRSLTLPSRLLLPRTFNRGLIDIPKEMTIINEKFLRNIGNNHEKPNLAKTTFPYPPFPVFGKFYDPSRFMICMACQLAEEPYRHPDAQIINVWFAVNTSSHETYLSKKTYEALFAPEKPCEMCRLLLQDPNYVVTCSYDPKFEEVNVLGSQALEKLKISIMSIKWRERGFVLLRDGCLQKMIKDIESV